MYSDPVPDKIGVSDGLYHFEKAQFYYSRMSHPGSLKLCQTHIVKAIKAFTRQKNNSLQLTKTLSYALFLKGSILKLLGKPEASKECYMKTCMLLEVKMDEITKEKQKLSQQFKGLSVMNEAFFEAIQNAVTKSK